MLVLTENSKYVLKTNLNKYLLVLLIQVLECWKWILVLLDLDLTHARVPE